MGVAAVRISVLALCLAGAVMPSAAAADTLRFQITDPDSTLGGQPFSPYYFFLDRDPHPTVFDSTSFTFDGTTYGKTYSDVAVMDTYTFHTGPDAKAPSFGGLDDLENFYNGLQLFTGPTSAPHFKTGTFALDNFGSGAMLTISVEGVSAVPETAPWAMMIAGFGGIGAMMRRRRRVAVRVRFA